MLTLVQRFPQQLEQALQIGQQYTFKTPVRTFQNILLTGLGGSGIGGSLIQNFTASSLKIPFVVNKDYFIPAFVGQDTLTIVCSYSGNTEETIMALEAASQKGSTVICITSGGAIAKWAEEKNTDCILVPEGMPPRSCLGYAIVQLLFVLQYFGWTNKSFQDEIKVAADFLQRNQKNISNEAEEIASQILGKTPVLYAETQWEGVAIRFRQQLNENSKLLCWHHVLPEMNHNELVGWRDGAADKVVIFLRNSQEYPRNTQRIEISQKVMRECRSAIVNIHAKGEGYWQELLYMIHLTDFISVALAAQRDVDATEVAVIDHLKGSLAKKGF